MACWPARRIREDPRIYNCTGMVEKPKLEDAPSKQAIIGRYVLTPRVFELLEQTTPGAGGEIQLTDGIKALLKEEKVFGYTFEGKRFDAGDKFGMLQATVEFALKRPEFGDKVPRISQEPAALSGVSGVSGASDQPRSIHKLWSNGYGTY